MRIVNTLSLLLITVSTVSAGSSFFFTENKGQIRDQHFKPRPDVLYGGSANGLVYHLKKDGLHYQLSRVESWKEERNAIQLTEKGSRQVPDKIGIYRVDVNWLNASSETRLYSGEVLPGYDHYYNVPTGAEPALFVKSYKTVNYHNLYEGVDLKFYTDENYLEYDFIVRPFANYKQIKIEIKGADLEVTPQKELKLITPFGNIIEGALKVYQGNKQIAADWIVEGNVVSFHIPHYDPTKPLRIDPPVRIWGTYMGGSDVEYAYGCAVDDQKRSFMSGFTYSNNNIATTGAHQTSYAGMRDAFLSSFAEWGTRRWSTYLGGSLDDVGYACEATPNGEAYIGGFAQSTSGISTNGAHQSSHGDAGTFVDGFVSKFDTSGVILWSTYLGGSWQDEIKAMALDTAGNLFITGYTQSSDNISTPGTYNPNYSGSKDVFLVKMSAAGSVLWGSYFGEANDDEATGCAVRDGKVALTGISNSTTGIATQGAHQTSLQGPRDIFVALFDTDGQLDWATYYGGTLTEDGGGVALDSLGNIYACGTTWSSSDISTSGAFQATFAGGTVDAFLVKFSPQGQRLWGTYLGGQGNDEALYCHVDPFGDIYFGGTTSSSSGIASPGAYKTFKGTSSNPTAGDAFLSKFRTNGTRIWSTYYGGEGGEVSYDVATDTAGNIFITGFTGSDQLLASENFSHQKLRGGVSDAFLIRFNNNNITLPEIPTSVTSLAENNFVLYPNPATNQLWLKTENVGDFTLRIFDMQGKLTEQHHFPNTQKFSINTEKLSNGVYLLQVSNSNASTTKRLIIQH
ncbi:MAG: SBBP repeat-containing protein [Chitinophagales bacterium]